MYRDVKMAPIPFVGKCFPTAGQFLTYLDGIKFNAWRPRYVVMHHTGAPSLKTWRGYGERPVPITDERWMQNLAAYYGNEMKWSAGPHFFFTPDNFCVLSLPDRRGVHAVSFNADSWGVECVGDFDSEAFTPSLANRYAEGFACLYAALGMQPGPFVLKQRGLHFHRDDPQTTKTCPGRKVDRDSMIKLIQAKLLSLTRTMEAPDAPPPPVVKKNRTGTVVLSDADPLLMVRDEPTGKSAVVRTMMTGDIVSITGEVKNGDAVWYEILGGDYVLARYVDLSG